VSDRYLLEVLKESCAGEIASCVDVVNCLAVLEAADACRLTGLKHLALEIISDNFSRIASAPDLPALPQPLLVEVIQVACHPSLFFLLCPVVSL
jgi:BTB And C-terminal Kelch